MQDTQKNFYKKLLGRKGELKARAYLKKNGYTILHNNFRAKSGEADIIALISDTLVFVEVKTRTNTDFGLPCEAVGFKKQNKYIKLAKEFLLLYNYENYNVRFDIIEILNGKINHIINAFTG